MKRLLLPSLFVFLSFLSACGGGGNPPVQPPPPAFETFQPAAIAIGQPSLSVDVNSGIPSASNLGNAAGISLDGTYTVVADVFRHRILGFHGVPTTTNQPADFVIGQPDFTSASAGLSAHQLDGPRSAYLYEGGLIVADEKNSRVLIWNTVPTTNAPADVVVGQPNFTTNTDLAGASGLAFPSHAIAAGGRLIVADYGNHRVLIWNAIPTTNGQPADVVLGQPDFVQNAAAAGASGMNRPSALWSDGSRLLVADAFNHRVLVWNAMPTSNGQPADLVLGQPDFATTAFGTSAETMRGPRGMAFDGAQLFVADGGNHRILIFEGMPTVNGAAADLVLGQSDFAHGEHNDANQDGVDDGHPSANTLYTPNRIAVFGDRLYVPEFHNHRVTIFVKEGAPAP